MTGLPYEHIITLNAFVKAMNEAIMSKELGRMSLDPKKSKEGKLKLCSPALHPRFSDPLVAVSEMSIEKGYAPLNYLDKDSSVTLTYLLAAAKRHIQKVELGIDINTEEVRQDGTACYNQPEELACAAYNLLMASLLLKTRPEADDRLFKDGVRKC